MGELNPAQKRGNAAALLPILVFLVLCSLPSPLRAKMH